MSDVDVVARLRQIGYPVPEPGEIPLVRAECARIARRLHQAGKKVIGVIPATADVSVPWVAVLLGLAFVELSGGTAAVIDANVRWPAFSRIITDQERQQDRSTDFFATRWLRGSLALLTPSERGEAGAGLPELRRAIWTEREVFAHLLVDLTGFDALGEHSSAISVLDGVIVAALAGRTREQDLLRWREEIPAERNLGVLLLGAAVAV